MTNFQFTYMALEAVLAATGIGSKSTLYLRVRQGDFPEPDHIGALARWRSDHVAAWLEKQAARADAERAERRRKLKAHAARMAEGRKAARVS